MNPNNQKIKS
jgi:hypothetical protein